MKTVAESPLTDVQKIDRLAMLWPWYVGWRACVYGDNRGTTTVRGGSLQRLVDADFGPRLPWCEFLTTVN